MTSIQISKLILRRRRTNAKQMSIEMQKERQGRQDKAEEGNGGRGNVREGSERWGILNVATKAARGEDGANTRILLMADSAWRGFPSLELRIFACHSFRIQNHYPFHLALMHNPKWFPGRLINPFDYTLSFSWYGNMYVSLDSLWSNWNEEMKHALSISICKWASDPHRRLCQYKSPLIRGKCQPLLPSD